MEKIGMGGYLVEMSSKALLCVGALFYTFLERQVHVPALSEEIVARLFDNSTYDTAQGY